MQPSQRKPEILAPAGGRAQLEAAVWAGADSVYFGLDEGLNARMRATSLALEALPETMGYLHERGVKGYLTLNTLVFDNELSSAERIVRSAAKAGVDALIVQDIGLMRLARLVAPALPLHASTQMSVTDAAGVAFAGTLGVTRVVIGRELTIDEIASVVATSDIEIEAFVHGALCVSYSGQCFSSEAWGGRSANRGQCAQACRLPYGLLVDGRLREQGAFRYLLSPQDLMAIELLPRLIRAGVSCFKIEGRLKGPDYVLATVSAYRESLDRIWSEVTDGRDVGDHAPLDRDRRRKIAQVFSRGQHATADGLTSGFLEGPNHQSVVIGRNPRHRGLFLGEVMANTGNGVTTRLAGPVRRGDGVVFDQGRPQRREVGGSVYAVIDETGEPLTDETDHGVVELRFDCQISLSDIRPGDLIWRSRDSRQNDARRLDPRLAKRPVPVGIHLSGRIGQPLQLNLSDQDRHVVTIASGTPLETATDRPIEPSHLRQAIGTLGDTPLRIVRFDCELPDHAFIPIGQIKSMRRAAVAQLLAQRRRHQRDRDLAPDHSLAELMPGPGGMAQRSTGRISLLCRTAAQVEAALNCGTVDELVLDFLEVHGLKQACEATRAAGRRLVVAAPRIFKPGEGRLWLYYCRLGPDALLVRSAGLLHELVRRGGEGAQLDRAGTRIPALYGDFSLNAANLLSADLLLGQGLQRLAITHDLNAHQIIAIASGLPFDARARLELIAHHHLPIFHSEYCVFARFLSNGNSYRDCGRPCERHRLHLRDPAGGDHLVLADIGCRNTVFNAQAQSAASLLNSFLHAGIGNFRIELVDEPAEQVASIVNGYQAVLRGELDADALQQCLEGVKDANNNAQGVGLGSLRVQTEMSRGAMKRPTAR